MAGELRIDANDYHSHSFFNDPLKKKIKKGMKYAKTVVHTFDDIINAIFSQSAATAVGAVFIIVSLIELEETIEEIQDLNKELTELETKLAEENDLQEKSKLLEHQKHLRRHIEIYILSKYLCWGAVFGSAAFIVLSGAGVAFAGSGLLPFAIMMAILVKQIMEFLVLQDELNEQCDIYDNSTSDKEKAEALLKIEEIREKQFYKMLEISAQILITLSFLAAAVSLSVLSVGTVPFALMITGAALGFLFKMYQMYKENKKEKKELKEDNEKLKTEIAEKDEIIAQQNAEIVNLRKQLAEKNHPAPQSEQKPYEPETYTLKKTGSMQNLTKTYYPKRFFPAARAKDDLDMDSVMRNGNLLPRSLVG